MTELEFFLRECGKWVKAEYHGRRLIKHANRIKRSAVRYQYHRNVLVNMTREKP